MWCAVVLVQLQKEQEMFLQVTVQMLLTRHNFFMRVLALVFSSKLKSTPFLAGTEFYISIIATTTATIIAATKVTAATATIATATHHLQYLVPVVISCLSKQELLT